MNWKTYASVLGPLAVFLIFDLYMRIKARGDPTNDEIIKIRFIESTFALFYLAYIAVLTGNVGLFGIIGTFIVAFAFVFKETISNFGATILLMMYPQLTQGDVVSLPGPIGSGSEYNYEVDLLFEKVGFMRSKLYTANGEVVLVPNSTLLNSTVSLK